MPTTDATRVLDSLPAPLRRTLEHLAGVDPSTVTTVFGLLVPAPTHALQSTGLATPGPLEDPETRTRPIVPTALAWRLLADLSTQLSATSLADARARFRAASLH